jgi:hypothetical protein
MKEKGRENKIFMIKVNLFHKNESSCTGLGEKEYDEHSHH